MNRKKPTSPLVGLRRQRGWSQNTLAKVADVALPTIRRIETGLCKPRTQTAMRLAEALGCGADDLFRYTMRRGVPGVLPR